MFRLIELPEPRCPVWALKLTTAGKTVYPTDCERYRCKKCGPVKLKKYIAHLRDVTLEEVVLHRITLPDEKVEAAKRAFRRRKAATWSIRFIDKSALIVSESECGGRGWSTTAQPKIELVADLLQTLEPKTIVRAGDFSRHWKRESEPRQVDPANVIYFGRFNSRRSVDEFLTDCGEDPYDNALNSDPRQLEKRVKSRVAPDEQDQEV